jgi:hypothetical protein
MPAEGHRHAPPSGRDDGRVDVELAVSGGHGELDPVREREVRSLDVNRRPQPGAAPTSVEPLHHPPSRDTEEEAVNRQSVAVDGQLDAVEIDGDPSGPEAA